MNVNTSALSVVVMNTAREAEAMFQQPEPQPGTTWCNVGGCCGGGGSKQQTGLQFWSLPARRYKVLIDLLLETKTGAPSVVLTPPPPHNNRPA